MASSLAQASAEFVDALRRGLDAYDAGDREQAYTVFSEALDIEPDNVWALLWKGASAPTPDEAILWLEQAQSLEPDNEHASAGLAWARGQTDSHSQLAPIRAAPMAAPAPEADLDWLSDGADDDMGSSFDTAGAAVASLGADEIMDWLDEGDGGFDSSLDFGSAMPSAPAPTAKAEEDLPDWLNDEGGDIALGDEMPDWLGDSGSTSTAPSLSKPATQVEEDLPDWLRDDEGGMEEAVAPVSGELPDWLSGTSGAAVDSGRRADGSLEPSGPVAEAYQAGLLAYEENRLDDATANFERTIQLDPNHVEAHNYLGSVYFLQGRTHDAIRAFQGALRLDADHGESHLNLGLVYQEMGDADRAVRMFERYLQLEPESSIAGEVHGFISTLRGG